MAPHNTTQHLSRKIFTELLVTKMGFTAAEIWCIMTDAPKGTYLLTFMSEQICRRYCQMCWSRREEKPFSDFHLECQLVLEVKRMTVHVYNPHVNVQDLTTFLRRHCTVTKAPSRNLDSDGIWDGKWTAMVKLKEDPLAPDGICHPPSSFSLGRDSGYLYYPGQPKLCNRCSKPGHTGKDCTAQICRNCKKEGHTAKTCKWKTPCNLCGGVGHLFKDCPKRAKSYAHAAQPQWRSQPEEEEAEVTLRPVPSPRQERGTGKGKGHNQNAPKPKQDTAKVPETQTPNDTIPEPGVHSELMETPTPTATEAPEEGAWTTQERRKRRHSTDSEGASKRPVSTHNSYSVLEDPEEEMQPAQDTTNEQLKQVTEVLREMRALANSMEASPPPSPTRVEEVEITIEGQEQDLPVTPEEADHEPSQEGGAAIVQQQATAAEQESPAQETRQEAQPAP
ncbi:uncharacterized protein LOC144806159 [Lissotriton helveticus]